MKSQNIILAAIAIVAPTIQAHSIWIEREKSGEAKAYFGEWQDRIKEKKGGYLDKLTGPKAYLGSTLETPLPLTHQDDHFAIEAKGSGDVRLIESTFKPYDDKAAGGKTRVVFLAKEGRAETAGKLDLELVPTAPGGNTFTLLLLGKPLPKTKVEVYGPPRWGKEFHTNEQGQVTIETPWAGRYVVEAQGKSAVAEAGAYDRSLYVFTVSFVTTKGQRWKDK